MNAAASSYDVIVIGGGIAGLSVAGELSRGARVLVLEAEAQPGYHSSGRSAAVYIEAYSNDVVFDLTRASLPFFLEPPEEYFPHPIATPLANMTLAPAEQSDQLDAYLARWQPLCPSIREISMEEAHRRLPVLRQGYAVRALWDDGSFALDTDLMLQGWLRMLRAHGGELVGDAPVQELARTDDRWRVATPAGDFEAPVVVNTAGAWAGRIGELAGAMPIPLQPKRRSALLIDPPDGQDIGDWPMVADVAHSYYFKPEGGRLMVSPADATPTEPCDARPDEYDLAVAAARVEEAADLGIRRFTHTWAGLRTFTSDEAPVSGWDELVEGFYWLAGQGGTGFQTAAAAARWAAARILGEPPPEDILAFGLTPEDYDTERFAGGAEPGPKPGQSR